jgi:type I restriction enzyme R subunit
VVGHTQGSGKSMEMELYANQVLTHPSLGNPTLVVLTDRTDRDDQLFTTFDTSDLLPEKAVQIGSREELREAQATRRMGGKFGRTKEERENGLWHPRMSGRRNHRDRR